MRRMLVFIFGILLISSCLVSAQDNKIWFGRNESNPAQYIPVLLTSTGVLRTDMNFSIADIWNTNIGQLTDANATQFDNVAGALTINMTWLNSIIGGGGSGGGWQPNNASEDNNYTTTGNVTAGFFFGDGSQLTGISGGSLSINETQFTNASNQINHNLTWLTAFITANTNGSSLWEVVGSFTQLISPRIVNLQDDLYVNSSTPEIKMIDSDNDGYTTITKNDTDNIAQRTNTLVSIVDGYALDFDGDDDEVDLGSILSSDELSLSGSAFTWSTWLYPDLTGDTSQRIFDKSTAGSAANGYALIIQKDGQVEVWISGAQRVDTATGVLDSSSWQNVIVTSNGVDTYVIYVDGVDVTNTQYSFANPPSATANMKFGTWNHATGREYDGKIDDTAIFDAELGATDITDLANKLYVDKDSNFPTSDTSMGDNLVGLWHFDEGTGTNTVDSSVNDKNGTLTNMNVSEAWIDGHISIPQTIEVNVWESKDGSILTFNEITGTTNILGNTNIGQLSGIAKLDILGDAADQITNLITMADGQTADAFVINNGSDSELFSVDSDGNVSMIGDLNVSGDLNVIGDLNVGGNFNPGFTAGSVPFQGASGLTENNGELFWDNTNDRLGIGTDTPIAHIDVRSDSPGDPLANFRGSSGQSVDVLQVQDSSANSLFTVSPEGYVAINNDGHTTEVGGGSITNQFLSYSTLENNYGDITAVKEAAVTTRGARWGTYKAGPNGAGIEDDNVIGEFSFFGKTDRFYEWAARISVEVDGTPANDTDIPTAMIFQIDGLEEAMRIESGGNVGIGEANPDYPLEISADNGGISAYFRNNVSAEDYLYHSPYPEESYSNLEALNDLMNVSGDGEIDHNTVPSNAGSYREKAIYEEYNYTNDIFYENGTLFETEIITDWRIIGYENESQTSMGMMIGNIIKAQQAYGETAMPTDIGDGNLSLKGSIAEFNEYATNTHNDTATMDKIATTRDYVKDMSFVELTDAVLDEGRLSELVINQWGLRGSTGSYNIEKAAHYGIAGVIMLSWENQQQQQELDATQDCIINGNTLQEIKSCVTVL